MLVFVAYQPTGLCHVTRLRSDAFPVKHVWKDVWIGKN